MVGGPTLKYFAERRRDRWNVPPTSIHRISMVTACYCPPVIKHGNWKPTIWLDDLPIQTSTCRGFSILLRIRHPPRRTGHSVDQQAAFGQGHPGHQEPGHHQRGAEEDQTWQRHAWGSQMIAEILWLGVMGMIYRRLRLSHPANLQTWISPIAGSQKPMVPQTASRCRPCPNSMMIHTKQWFLARRNSYSIWSAWPPSLEKNIQIRK